MAPESLMARYQRLRAEVAGHKSAIRRHREQLQTAAAALTRIEDECRSAGISLVINPAPGEGQIHGHTERLT